MFKTKAQRLAELLEGVPEPPAGSIPPSAIRALRGDRSQAEVALKSGITQAALSRLEGGQRSLSPEMARKIAPALNVTATDLLAAEWVGRLHASALKGELDPRKLLSAVEDLAWTLPEGQVSDDIIERLLGVLKKAVETYDGEATAVATKSKKESEDSTRDGLGRRKKVALKSSSSEAGSPPRRDTFGQRIHKPNDPGGR